MNVRKAVLRVLVDLILHPYWQERDQAVLLPFPVCFSLGLHYLAFWDRNALGLESLDQSRDE